MHLKSQKKVQITKSINIKHLYSCLNEQGITKFDLKELEKIVGSTELETLDAKALEEILAKNLF